MSLDWEAMSRIEAKEITDNWTSLLNDGQKLPLDDTTIVNNIGDKNKIYKDLRKLLVEAAEEAKSQSIAETGSDKLAYAFDVIFGKKLFEILSNMNFGVRQASYNPVWYYISLKVIPDVIYVRWGKKKDGTYAVPTERLWDSSMRIYPKQLWWYYYLSMLNGDDINTRISATYDMLKKNTSDTLVQFVERAGIAGYRVDLWRAIIRYYTLNTPKNLNKQDWFRRAMVYNTFQLALVEPALMEGGINAYVEDIFKYADRKEEV